MRGKQDSWMEAAPASGDGPADASVGTSTVGMNRKWLGRAMRVLLAGALVATSGLVLTAARPPRRFPPSPTTSSSSPTGTWCRFRATRVTLGRRCLLYTSPSPQTRHDLVCRLLLE